MAKIHPTAIVSTASIGAETIISEYSVIREGVTIGRNVIIHPHVVIEDGVVIGNNVEIFPGAYLGKEPKGVGALSRLPQYVRHTEIGDGVSIGPHVVIYCDVIIGSQTLIGDGVSIREQTRIGSRCVIGRFVTVNYNTIIGDRTKVMDHSWLAGNMSVGSDVFISGGVLTSNDNTLGRHPFDNSKMVGPTIDDGAMIGIGAVLLPGICVGAGAIVAAGAVVTRDVAASDTVLGPAARRRDRAGET